MLIERTQNVHSMVARLLATENIGVLFGSYHTASFDPKNRVLRMPVFKDSNEPLVNEMMIAHEVGHAWFTPPKGWHNIPHDIPGIPNALAFNLVNIVEDIRIEKLIQAKYPGLITTFTTGYKGLWKIDFFKTKGKNVNHFGFLDRLNIFSKMSRTGLNVTFSAEEQPYVDRALAVETWEDVIKVCQDLAKFLKQKKEEADKLRSPMANAEKEKEREKPQSQGEAAPSNDEEESEETSGGSKSNPSEKEAKADELDQNYSSSMETDTYETAEMDALIEKSDKTRYVTANYKMLKHVFRDSLINSIANEKRQMKYEKYDRGYAEVLKEVKPGVDALMQQFNMLKSAILKKRTALALTGKLNVDKLSTYKFNDQIFLSQEIVQKQQSHGVVIMIDGSGSMGGAGRYNTKTHKFESSPLGSSFYVSIMVAIFCRRMKLPFSAFVFSSGGVMNFKPDITTRSDCAPNAYSTNISLTKLLSSEQSEKDFRRCVGFLYQFYKGNEGSSDYGSFHGGGTPLAVSTLALATYISEFKKNHKLQQVHTLLFTDGAGDDNNLRLENSSAPASREKTIVDIDGKRHVYTSGKNQKSNHGDQDAIFATLRKVSSTLSNFYIGDGQSAAGDKFKHIPNKYGTEVPEYLEHDSYFFLNRVSAFASGESIRDFSKIICKRIGQIVARDRKE